MTPGHLIPERFHNTTQYLQNPSHDFASIYGEVGSNYINNMRTRCYSILEIQNEKVRFLRRIT